MGKQLLHFTFALLLLSGIIYSCKQSENGNEKKAINPNRERSEIEDKYKWNVADLYPTIEGWEKDKAAISERITKVAAFKGQLGSSSEELYNALEFVFDIMRDMEKFYVYAQLSSDQDLRESAPLRMRQEADKLGTDLSTATSFIKPEILAISEAKLNKFFKEKADLGKYSMYIDNITKLRSHTLDEEQETIIAKAGLMSGIAQEAHNVLSNAELPYEKATLSDGSKVIVNVSTYEKYRYSPNREDRIKVFNAFYNSLANYKSTCGVLLSGKLKENLFYTSVKKYNSSLEAALTGRNLPTNVYTNLIENVHKSLPLLHRYLKIRKRMLGVDEFHYYDMYPDLVKSVDIRFTYEEATENIKNALQILGEEYASKLNEAFGNRWIDVYPSMGKASGAYSNSVYGSHPYIKVNFNGKYPDVSMLAHELGHSMHSYFSNKTQPFATSNYSSFVAEVASTVNEALLSDYILKQVKDPHQKLSLMGSYLEACRQTLFRQTLFAEFELTINQKAEAGASLTHNDFKEIYLDLLKKYYGHEEGITVIDDIFGDEWVYISHLYLGYYNYQYSTSYIAAEALSQKMITEGQKAVDDYICFLSSGCNDYSIPLLKKAGVDMTSEEPFKLATAKIESVLDEMEKLLDELKIK